MALELEQTDGADELGLERRPELVAAAQDDLGDRVRVAGIGLAGPQSATIAMRAPGRHVENLKAGARHCRRQRPPEPGRVLDADDRGGRVVLDEPGDECAIALGALANSSVSISPPRASSSAAAWRCLWQSMPTNNLDDLLVWVEDRGRAGEGRFCVDAAAAARNLLSSHSRRPARNPPVDKSSAGQQKRDSSSRRVRRNLELRHPFA